MSAFAEWLVSFVVTYLTKLYNVFIDLIQGVIDGLANFLIGLVSLFPVGDTSPVYSSSPGGLYDSVVGLINWVLPVQFMAQSVAWLAAGMLLYLAIAPLARWAKLLK